MDTSNGLRSRKGSLTAIGLMSGTSMDGIDAAIIKTDGHCVDRQCVFPSISLPYSDTFRKLLQKTVKSKGKDEALLKTCEHELTHLHAEAVTQLLQQGEMDADSIDVIGFHGHTILHDPEDKFTHQIGDGPLLEVLTGVPVVYNFRQNDVAHGGQGAPLVPIYHRAIVHSLEKPVVILNIGGVANLTWVGDGNEENILAFDTGPGNGLIDDWVLKHTGKYYDEDGRFAAIGKTCHDRVSCWLEHPYFKRPPPKSLDRYWEDIANDIKDMSLNDGAATLLEFTVQAILKAQGYFKDKPKRWLVSGGGRHNRTLMSRLSSSLLMPVEPIEVIGFDGDMIEAEAFAFLAVRFLKGLCVSYPSTTGVKLPVTAGVAAS